MSYRIGLDLGGTKVLGVMTDSDHKVIHRKKHRLSNRADISAVMDQTSNVYSSLTEHAGDEEIASVGIALPSPVDNKLGHAKYLTAFQEKELPVRDMLKERTGVDI